MVTFSFIIDVTACNSQLATIMTERQAGNFLGIVGEMSKSLSMGTVPNIHNAIRATCCKCAIAKEERIRNRAQYYDDCQVVFTQDGKLVH